MRTPYSIHMSYPSARSLYTLRMYIAREHSLLTKDFFDNNVLIRISPESWENVSIKEGDIIIETLPFQDKHYPYLFKTLQNLEAGHLLYNISYLAKLYGYKYTVDNGYPTFLILRQILKGSSSLSFRDKLNDFWQQAKLRTSGKYYGGLINFDADYQKYRYEIGCASYQTTLQFQSNPANNVIALPFINTGNAYVNEKYGLTCSYYALSKEYRYVNFRTQTQIYLIPCKTPTANCLNYADVIQYMGMLAQEICINNAQSKVYNRPIKQIAHTFWKPILLQRQDLNAYIPFYGVITGKDSIPNAVYRQMV